MNIIWITGRSVSKDLAGTTEIGLINGLSKLGHSITLFCPDNSSNEINCKQITFNRVKIKGIETISGTRYLRKLIIKNENEIKNSDIILIDWRYVVSLKKTLIKYGKKWVIIDRGPPAYSGILSKIQSIIWKKSWRIASKYSNGGFTVSSAHKEYVNNILNGEMDIKVIPAGTNVNDFSINKMEKRHILKFIYAGRLDENRGMSEIIKMYNNMHRLKIKTNLIIIGEGNYSNEIEELSLQNSNLIFYGKLSRKETLKIMNKCDVGILPMPDTPIWKIASPLKLAEYAASGLVTIGPKHSGNKIERDAEWSLLSSGNMWFEEYIELINKIIEEDGWNFLSEIARKDAKELDWSEISNQLADQLDSMK